MLEKCKTWLPVFQGFYGSGIEDDNDLEYTIFDNPDDKRMLPVHKNWLVEEITDYIDYSDYHNELSDAICESICEELESQELISDYKFEGLVSPKYYNFRNDHIDVELEVDIIHLIELCKKSIEGFKEYLKNNYTSYDGFMSSYSNDSDDWFGELSDYTDGLIMNDTGHCIGAILNFLITDNEVGCYQDLVYEAASAVYISEYIDWGKMIEDFNDNFETNAKSIRDDIETGNIDETDPEVIARRDLVGQKLFNFELV
jgi:hypothetical protein